jgi:O-antigen ligase
VDKLTSRAITVCLLLLAFAAPLSIAATQAAWAFGLLFWIFRAFFVRPRPKFEKLDLAIFAFVGLSLVSSFFSYEPGVSLRKMVSVSLVTIVYLVATNLKEHKTLHRMLVLIMAGCFIACAYTFATQAIGKNLKVVRFAVDSPLRTAGVQENDTILTANGRNITTPDDLVKAITEASLDGVASVTTYRHELVNTYKFPAAVITDANSLGIAEHQRGRDTRAAGFFGHYTTFAEALQLLASLAVALMIVAPGGILSRNRVLLGVVVASAIVALFLSLTRASWLSFVVASSIIVLLSASRRTIVICALIAVPVVIGGLVFLQQKRNISFIDSKDDSTTWRTMVWKEGFDVLTQSPRHLLVGIGMDSLKTHWKDWHMFDDGRQPVGHLHNDYLQIAFERGIPTLLAWIAWMAFYLAMLWKNIRSKAFGWPASGLLVGAFGGTIGFLTSGTVHYNWGDSEVVMIFYLIMGMSLAVIRHNSRPYEGAVASASADGVVL